MAWQEKVMKTVIILAALVGLVLSPALGLIILVVGLLFVIACRLGAARHGLEDRPRGVQYPAGMNMYGPERVAYDKAMNKLSPADKEILADIVAGKINIRTNPEILTRGFNQ
jgi:hypothetical protein